MGDRIRKAVVLTGGVGGLKALTGDHSKCMVEIAGKRVVDYVVEGISRQGISELVVVVDDADMRKHIIDVWAERLRVEVVEQKKPGIEGAIATAGELIGRDEVFLLAYGDVVMPPSAYSTLLDSYVEALTPLHALLAPTATPQSYGVVIVEGQRIVEVVEKPRDTYYSTLALAGAFIVHARLLEEVEAVGLPGLYRKLASLGSFTGAVWNGWWVDIDLPWDVLTAVRAVLGSIKESRISGRAEISSSAILEGPVIVEEGAEIDHQAIVKGPAYIGRGAFVGAGAFIREYTALEEGSTVGFRSEVKRSSLQRRATVSGFSYIADSVIGEEASMSVGVKTLNVLPPGVKVERVLEEIAGGRKLKKLGAIVGRRARVGAGAVLYPGATVSPSAWVEPLSKVESPLQG